MYYLWPTRDAFDAWHDAVCVALGIPHPNRNAATGDIDPDAQWTTAYTDATVNDDGCSAFVEGHIAAAHSDGLGAPYTPPTPDDPMEES